MVSQDVHVFSSPSEAQAWLEHLPLPGFIGHFTQLEEPAAVSPPLAALLQLHGSQTHLSRLLELESTNVKNVLTWSGLLQMGLPTHVLCRLPSNERMKLSLFSATLENKPAVFGLITPFQEDVAMTQAHHDFVSIMSHEFRTPLTSIRGFADTMLHYGAKLDATQQQRFIRIIRDQADRLSRMVENVLTISRLGQESKPPKPQPLILKKVVNKVEGALQGKGVDCAKRFHYEQLTDATSVWAEPDGLEQVILNLMDNAVKYSPADKPITFRVGRCDIDPDRYLKVMIIDQGSGMTEEQRQKLFRRFYRTSNHMTQEVEGSGLGLYITKTLVQRMGGAIGVRTTPGEGSTFWFTVPLNTLENQNNYRNSIEVSGEQLDEDALIHAAEPREDA
jgi:signal transduction histidine kinase